MVNAKDFQPVSGRMVKDDGTIVNQANGINTDGSKNVAVKDFDTTYVLPMEIQRRLATTVQVIDALAVGANAWSSNTAFFDVDGWDKAGVTVSMTGGTGMIVAVDYSHDGTTYFASAPSSDTFLYDGSANNISSEISVLARFIRISVKNKDGVNPKTVSAYIYPKA